MDLHVLLKRLIAAQIVLFCAMMFLDPAFADLLPPELIEYNNRLAEDETENFLRLTFGLPLLALYLSALFFLWRLKRFGRTLFTATWAVSLLLTGALKPAAYHAVSEVFGHVFALIDGLIFGLIYFSDLRFHFSKKPAELV